MKSTLRQLANEHFLGLLDRAEYRQKRRELIDSLLQATPGQSAGAPIFGGSAGNDFGASAAPREALIASAPDSRQAVSPQAAGTGHGLLTQPMVGDPFAAPAPGGSFTETPRGADLTDALSAPRGDQAGAAGPASSLSPLDALAALDARVDNRGRGDTRADRDSRSGGERTGRAPRASIDSRDDDAAPYGETGGKTVKVVVLSLLAVALAVLIAALIFIS